MSVRKDASGARKRLSRSWRLILSASGRSNSDVFITPEDVHQVYLNMYLNTGWVGGTFYLLLVLMTIAIGLRRVLRDRGGDGVTIVLLAAFLGMAVEGLVVDTDHWRHFYLIMALIWGMALAPSGQRRSGL